MTHEDVIKDLLDRLEFILDDEYSSKGDSSTAFARGWLGYPMIKERPDLDKEYCDGSQARKESGL